MGKKGKREPPAAKHGPETEAEATTSVADVEGVAQAAEAQPKVEEVSSDMPSGGPSEEELSAARAEAEQYKDRWMRAAAELENVRRRAAREQVDLMTRAGERILKQILDPVDNLARAIKAAKRSEASGEDEPSDGRAGLLQGIEMVYGQCMALLERENVRPMETVGKPFDPSMHDALAVVERDDHPPNTVVEEIERGYWLGERVLRHAKVVVSKAPASAEQETGEDGDKPSADD